MFFNSFPDRMQMSVQEIEETQSGVRVKIDLILIVSLLLQNNCFLICMVL